MTKGEGVQNNKRKTGKQESLKVKGKDKHELPAKTPPTAHTHSNQPTPEPRSTTSTYHSTTERELSTSDAHSMAESRRSKSDGHKRASGRVIHENLWEVCCNETEAEIKEYDTILEQLGLPPVNYTKTKNFELTDYETPPPIVTSKCQDFLDFYIFPYLLPAIEALIQFVRQNRVFQSRFFTFNALDFIVEYLYNNNPRYPERLENPTSIFEIPFCIDWLDKHPRNPPPKWMLMSSDEAALIIQSAVRGYMVRSRPDVQEMRQFWRDYKQDLELERAFGRLSRNFQSHRMLQEEMEGEINESDLSVEADKGSDSTPDLYHSENCIFCKAFGNYLDSLPPDIVEAYMNVATTENNESAGNPPNNTTDNTSKLQGDSALEDAAATTQPETLTSATAGGGGDQSEDGKTTKNKRLGPETTTTAPSGKAKPVKPGTFPKKGK